MSQEESRLSVHQREREAQRQVRRARRKARRGLLRGLGLATIAVIALALIGSLILPSILNPGGGQRKALSPEERAKGPGQHLTDQGAQHIAEGSAFSGYNSIPPTSGFHWPVPAKWGIHEEPVPNERQVHNLEHGGVHIQYTTQDPEIAKNVKELAQSLRAFPSCILVAPYPNMEHPIALTAWGVLLTLDTFDRKAIVDFVNVYRDQGPERTACAEMGGQ